MNHVWSEDKILSHYQSGKHLYAAQSDPSIKFPAPRFLSIWISQICNLDCTYCYFADSNHNPEKTFIKTDEIIPWLLSMRQFGAEALEFSGGGEPTVHKDFEKIFTAAADMGYATGLITHACNPMPIDVLASKAKYVRCGIDAANQATHAKIKRKEGKFHAALDNVERLVTARDRNKSKSFTVGIKVTLNAINEGEVNDIVRMARYFDVDYLQLKYEHSSDNPIAKDRLDELQKIFDEHEKNNYLERTKILGNVMHQRATVKCFMSPIHTVVDASGQILQCCFMDKRPIGTIREKIQDVWGGPKHREVMKMTTVQECDKVDCRWNALNRQMKEIIEDPLQRMSFI